MRVSLEAIFSSLSSLSSPASPRSSRRTASAFVMAVALASATTATACTTATATSAPAPAPSSAAEPEPGESSAPAADPAKAKCDAQSAALQRGLDDAHAADTDVALAVRDPACGARVLFSGPSKLGPAHLHRIGSVTKTFVAAVVLTLARDGALGLDDAVSKWLPDVPGLDGITLRQLLHHSSGLFNYTDDAQFWKSPPSRKWTPRELVDVGARNAPYFAPGTSWHYSNTNYILLGMVAEAAGKAKIGALVRTRVLAKAGLSATFFDGEEPVTGTLAPAQDARGNDATTVADPSWAWAAGAMVATPGDVALWIEQLGNGTFYDPTTQKELLTTVPTDSASLGYGLGIMLFGRQLTGGAGPGIGHGGDIMGYHTQSFYFPEKKTTVVSIVDSDAESSNDVSIVALDVLFAK